MSCSVCRLPFIPDLAQATFPLAEHTPHESIVPIDQSAYFKFAFGTGPRIGLKKLCYFSANMFGAVVEVDVLVWESAGGTFFMAHLVCFSLLRQALNLEDEDKATTIAFSAHELILGRPQDGMHAGRFRDVQYENVGEKVDLSPFWKRGTDPGLNVFDWRALKSSSLKWLVQRPDIFPRFSLTVTEARLNSVGEPLPESERTDYITTMPLDLILHLLLYLPLKSYIALTATCRFMRLHALTTFQPHARTRVLALPWATPSVDEARRTKTKYLSQMASREDSAAMCCGPDWFKYLNEVHWTRSMRVRRWIWALCEEIKRVWEEKEPESEWAVGGDGVKSKARIKLESDVENKLKQDATLKVMNEWARKMKAAKAGR